MGNVFLMPAESSNKAEVREDEMQQRSDKAGDQDVLPATEDIKDVENRAIGSDWYLLSYLKLTTRTG